MLGRHLNCRVAHDFLYSTLSWHGVGALIWRIKGSPLRQASFDRQYRQRSPQLGVLKSALALANPLGRKAAAHWCLSLFGLMATHLCFAFLPPFLFLHIRLSCFSVHLAENALTDPYSKFTVQIIGRECNLSRWVRCLCSACQLWQRGRGEVVLLSWPQQDLGKQGQVQANKDISSYIEKEQISLLVGMKGSAWWVRRLQTSGSTC